MGNRSDSVEFLLSRLGFFVPRADTEELPSPVSVFLRLPFTSLSSTFSFFILLDVDATADSTVSDGAFLFFLEDALPLKSKGSASLSSSLATSDLVYIVSGTTCEDTTGATSSFLLFLGLRFSSSVNGSSSSSLSDIRRFTCPRLGRTIFISSNWSVPPWSISSSERTKGELFFFFLSVFFRSVGIFDFLETGLGDCFFILGLGLGDLLEHAALPRRGLGKRLFTFGLGLGDLLERVTLCGLVAGLTWPLFDLLGCWGELGFTGVITSCFTLGSSIEASVSSLCVGGLLK